MAQDRGNLFEFPPARPAGELFENLLTGRGWRLERIVSTGQATAPGEWLTQDRAEWVVLLGGSAVLRFADETEARALRPGDWLWIAPWRRHRVERTGAAPPAVWLALHHDDALQAGQSAGGG